MDNQDTPFTPNIDTLLQKSENHFLSNYNLRSVYDIYSNMSGPGGGIALGLGDQVPSQFTFLSTLEPALMSSAERVRLARHLYRFNSIVGSSIDINVEVPLSKIKLSSPDIPNDPDLSKYIHNFFSSMVANLRLFSTLLSVAHEYWLVGDAYIWCEFSSDFGVWTSVSLLFGQFETSIDPVQGNERIFLKVPEDQLADYEALVKAGQFPEDQFALLQERHSIELPTDPYLGSFCYHLSRRPSDAYSESVSIVDRVMSSIILSELLLSAKTAIVKRALRNKEIYSLTVDGQPVPEYVVSDFEYKLWAAQLDPDFPIVTNYSVEANVVGFTEKDLDISAQLESLFEVAYSGLGLSKSILQGEAAYSGERISLEVINTRFLMFRQVIADFVEEFLFKPVAYYQGFYVKLAPISRDYLHKRLLRAFIQDDKSDANSSSAPDFPEEPPAPLAPEAGSEMEEMDFGAEPLASSPLSDVADGIIQPPSNPNDSIPRSPIAPQSPLDDSSLTQSEQYAAIYAKSDPSVKLYNQFCSSNRSNLRFYGVKPPRFAKFKSSKIKSLSSSEQRVDLANSNSNQSAPYGIPDLVTTTTRKQEPQPSQQKTYTPADISLDDPHVIFVIPKLQFTRVALTDSAEAYASIFSLIEAGKLPIAHAYSVLGLDAEDVEAELEKSYFTTKDPKFSSFMENLYTSLASKADAGGSALMDLILSRMNLPKDTLDKVHKDLSSTGADGADGF